jgi:hypothetical protein
LSEAKYLCGSRPFTSFRVTKSSIRNGKLAGHFPRTAPAVKLAVISTRLRREFLGIIFDRLRKALALTPAFENNPNPEIPTSPLSRKIGMSVSGPLKKRAAHGLPSNAGMVFGKPATGQTGWGDKTRNKRLFQQTVNVARSVVSQAQWPA